MPPTKQRILCVDNRASRNLAVLMLERAQYEVTTAGSMTQALKLAGGGHFDSYLINHRLRGGSKLCGKLGEFDPRTPILFYSSVTYPYHQKRAVGCETAGDPMMPVDIGEMVEVVSKLINYRKKTAGPDPILDDPRPVMNGAQV